MCTKFASTACNLHLKVWDHFAEFYETALCDPRALEKDQLGVCERVSPVVLCSNVHENAKDGR